MNRFFKKAVILIFCVVLVIGSLTGCGKKEEKSDAEGLTAHEAIAAGEAAVDAADASTVPETEPETTPKYSKEDYKKAGVDELNSAPIMMYHRIYDVTIDETDFTGGNVDEDGYNRSWEAFANDLEQFYQDGYRMIRLEDYLDGVIDTPFGYSPLVLTFDDGIRCAVLDHFDENGEPVFEEHCAMGILESFKKKYPDYNVTATFFMNSRLFQNGEDDAKVIQWMVDNGYDIGNHTSEHPNLSECTYEEIATEVGKMYEMLEGIIPGRYVNIIALPYGIPTDVSADPKYDAIFHCDYNGNHYETKATLLCSWTRENSPFHKDFDLTYVKRIRGYDHDGTDFDIEQNFAELNAGRRYISDGDPSTIVIHENDKEWLGDDHGLTLITY